MVEDVFTEVVGDEAMSAADDKGIYLALAAHGERCELNSSDPTFQLGLDRFNRVRGQIDPQQVVEECARFFHPELKILGSQLQEFIAGAVAGQRQRRLITPGQHEMDRWR